MRKARNPLWPDIWILLVRYLEKYLHSDIQLANCMLKMIEHAFQNPQDRIVSYDCWKALIDTYNCDASYVKNPKHINLLMKPMKNANLGKTDPVLLKKFEVWVHLIKNLKENATICLNAFLKFCFGSLSENSMMLDNSESGIVGKKCLSLQKDATEVLQELLGEFKEEF